MKRPSPENLLDNDDSRGPCQPAGARGAYRAECMPIMKKFLPRSYPMVTAPLASRIYGGADVFELKPSRCSRYKNFHGGTASVKSQTWIRVPKTQIPAYTSSTNLGKPVERIWGYGFVGSSGTLGPRPGQRESVRLNLDC